MQTIELTAVVGPDRKVAVQLPAGVSEGTHRMVVVVDDATVPGPAKPPEFRPYPVKPADDDATFRREELYDDGR